MLELRTCKRGVSARRGIASCLDPTRTSFSVKPKSERMVTVRSALCS